MVVTTGVRGMLLALHGEGQGIVFNIPQGSGRPSPHPAHTQQGMTRLQMPEVLQENPVQGRPAPPQCPTVVTDPNAVTSRVPPDSKENFNAA